MITKALQTMAAIASDPPGITDITQSGSEYYFKFKGHFFSILHRQSPDERGRYSFYVYPGWTGTSAGLSGFLEYGSSSNELVMVNYDSVHYNDEPFRSLYTTVEERCLGIDKIFDDVLEEN